MHEIEAQMAREHEGVERLVAQLRTGRSAARLLPLLRERLERHFTWEENVVFPLVERRCPQAERSELATLRREHAELRAILSGTDVRKLLGPLERHKEREERSVYAWLDDNLSRGERTGLLKEA